VAELLEDAARAAANRGAPEAAAELVAQARRLTPPEDVDARARRHIDEIDYRFLAGADATARQLLDELLQTDVRGSVRARALILRSWRSDSPAASREALEEAVVESFGHDLLHARATTLLVWQRGAWAGFPGDLDAEVEFAVALAERTGDAWTLASALTTAGTMLSFRGKPGAPAHLSRAVELGEQSHHRQPGDHSPRIAYAHDRIANGDWTTAEELLEREREDAGLKGDESRLLVLRVFLAALDTRRGHWDNAERLLGEVLASTMEYWRAAALAQRVLLRGRRGDERGEDDARALAATVFAQNDPDLASDGQAGLGLLRLAHGDAAGAAALLVPPLELLERRGWHQVGFAANVPDAVQALLAGGETTAAGSLVNRLGSRALEQRHAWGLPAAAWCRGQLLLAEGDPGGALAELVRASEGFALLGAPFELARTYLTHGHALRRLGRRTDAAASLEAAATSFATLGAEPWRARAEQELRRAQPRRRRDDSLTAAESRVATLVAAGRKNREVAAELFTTVATVEAHLTRIYRKLALRSRTELARAVADGSRRARYLALA